MRGRRAAAGGCASAARFGDDDPAQLARVVAEGAHLGCYENDFYQQHDEDEEPPLEEFIIVVPTANAAMRAALERARIVAESANWARALADEPGGSLPPREFARRAAEMAAECGLRVETLNADEVRARGMGGLWGVGQGSDEPPALIVLRYEPEGATEETNCGPSSARVLRSTRAASRSSPRRAWKR
jgi:leucyl aminopeptidase